MLSRNKVLHSDSLQDAPQKNHIPLEIKAKSCVHNQLIIISKGSSLIPLGRTIKRIFILFSISKEQEVIIKREYIVMAETDEVTFYHSIVTRSRVVIWLEIKRYQISDFFLLYQHKIITKFGHLAENNYTNFN